MSRYKKLAGNSIILTIGNFGSKFINFFMVPLYTSVLTTSEYGLVDIMITTISLLLPILTMELGSAIVRYAIEYNTQRKQEYIFNNLLILCLFLGVLVLMVTPVLVFFNAFQGHGLLFSAMLIIQVFNNLLLNYTRGVGKIKEFALNGVLTTVVTVASNLFFLLVVRWGVVGYILSIILALLVSNAYIMVVIRKYINFKNIHFEIDLFKEMTRFSIPLIPNSIMWWIVNGATRYFILFFVGTSGNGLFAVANKIPSIISSVMTVFMQSWQLSSFEEYDSSDRDVYYSNVFKVFSSYLFIMASFLVIFNKFIMNLFVSDSFYESWRIVPILVLGVVFQSFSNFLGTVYSASKLTKKAFSTTVYGGITSIIANIVLVPLFGVVGASIAVATSFFVIFLIRLVDIRKFMSIDIQFKKFSLNCLIIILQIIIQLLTSGVVIHIIEISLLLVLLLNNKQFVILALKQVKQMVFK